MANVGSKRDNQLFDGKDSRFLCHSSRQALKRALVIPFRNQSGPCLAERAGNGIGAAPREMTAFPAFN